MRKKSIAELATEEGFQRQESETRERMWEARRIYGVGPEVERTEKEWKDAHQQLQQWQREHSDLKANQPKPTVPKGTADAASTKDKRESSSMDERNKQRPADVAPSGPSLPSSEPSQAVASASESSQSSSPSLETSQDSLIQGSTGQPANEHLVAQPRIVANRRNALRSTGPKSVRGKKTSACNALKHGLLSRSVVITRGPAKESKAEFKALLNGLRDYFGPVGTAEEMLVEEIAVSYWMEQRAQLYEKGEISKQLREAVPEYEPWKEIGYGQPNEAWIHDCLEKSEGYNLLKYPEGVEYVLGIIEDLRIQMATDGKVPSNLSEQLSAICGGDWQTVRQRSLYLSQLRREKRKLKRLWGILVQKEAEQNAQEDAEELQSALLLDEKKLALVLRYTAANEKRRYRALAQLERLQRQRNGEAIPPPINVQVTDDAVDFTKRSQ
jgi:hypothetical protein